MIPPARTLHVYFSNEDQAIAFLTQRGVFRKPEICQKCGGKYFRQERKLWRCTNKECRKAISVVKGTFFEMHRLQINEMLEIAYYWLAGLKHKSAMMITGHADKTITAMFGYLRQLVGDSLDEEDLVIGGPGIVVEIDEAKFGKRKYNVGHAVNGAWVLGGVERTSERKTFMVEVADRTAATLLDCISKHVAPGSTIHTDCFSSYSQLYELFQHKTVNHSINFRDPETGCHTNSIEGTWNGVKLNISPRNRTAGAIDDHLAEFIWRRKSNNNLWDAFINALQEIAYLA
jgi:transposase-like protein